MRFSDSFIFNGLSPLKMAAHPCTALVPAVYGRARANAGPSCLAIGFRTYSARRSDVTRQCLLQAELHFGVTSSVSVDIHLRFSNKRIFNGPRVAIVFGFGTRSMLAKRGR